MFPSKKTPKSQKPSNLPLYFHRFHTKEVGDYNILWEQDYRQLTTFDIGYENLCMRMSRRYFQPKRVDPLVFDKTHISIDPDQDNYQVLFRDIETWLDSARQEYFNTHVIIIEWQLPVNYNSVRISTFILSYFFFLLKDTPLLPIIVEMRSGFKDDYFPILKPLNQNARKSKCEEIGCELALTMGDRYSYDIITSGTSRKKKKKGDDYADTLIMEEVFCRYAAARGWNFPHYEKMRRILLSRPIKIAPMIQQESDKGESGESGESGRGKVVVIVKRAS